MKTSSTDRRACRTVAAALAITALLAGCGGSRNDPTASTQDAPETPAIAHPHIVSPANGDVIPATAALGDSRGAKITVKGTAQPNTKVVITSGCQLANCSLTVSTDAAGKFTATVSANTTTSNHAATITVSYEISEAVDSDRVIITLGEQDSGGDANQMPTATPRSPSRKHKPRTTSTAPPSVTVAPPAQTAAPQATTAPTTSSGGSGGSGPVVVIGDSLAEGMKPYLQSALPGRSVSIDSRIGRPLAEGMQIFSRTTVRQGTVYAFSLFTNDSPSSVSALEQAVRTSVQRAGCAVWATIVRPAVGGVSYNAANTRLRTLAAGSLAGQLQLVDWAAAVQAHPQWVPGADGVHSSPDGYRNRAALYAQAIKNCS